MTLETSTVAPNEMLQATLERLFKAAADSKGRTLGPLEVRGVCAYIINLQRANQMAVMTTNTFDNLLNAYINEYGQELLDELLADEGVVDGEVVSEEDGLDNEDAWLDTSEEE